MNEASGEESIDSIPRPEYETIKGGSTTSTPIEEALGNVEAAQTSNKITNAPLQSEEEAEAGADEEDEEEEMAEEEASSDGEEEFTNNLNKENLNYTTPSKTVTEKAVASEVPSKMPASFVFCSADNNEIKSNGPPMPVQIIAAPKILPAKTKDNKFLLVQVISDTGKPVTAVASGSTTADKSAETTPQKVAIGEQQSMVRSSTPLSREFLALQKSVNESKILSEFVTDGMTVKARKLRKPGINTKDGTVERIDSRKIAQATSADALGPPASPYATNSAEKRRKYAPLRDEQSSSDSDMKPRQRSRSKSVNRKSPVALFEASGSKLKKWPSDEKILKRTNMRSQNSEFVQKQMEFLSRVMQQQREDGDVSDIDYYTNAMLEAAEDDNSNGHDSTINESGMSLLCSYGNLSQLPTALDTGSAECVVEDTGADMGALETRLKAIWQPPPKRGSDVFCWKCRECGDLIPCSKCVRCFHTTCIKINASTKLDNTWICPECVCIENVLSSPRRARRNDLSLDLLSQLLSFALKRMRNVKGYTKALFSSQNLTCYVKYIVNPVTFNSLQEKIEKKVFRCAEEFVNETKWMLHNALILSNSITNSKEALSAKGILKICRQEANEIDTCAECYLNANTRSDWFVDVCAQPHLLVWAKLKGFPYWPAKAMGPGQGSLVNVRFFGEHDRAFVPVKDCFLYSEQDPNTQTGKRSARELADCIKEVEVHIEKIKAKVGDFKYATYKTPFDPAEELQQLEIMMPGVTDYMNRQQVLVPKPPLQYKIVKTADNHLSIIKKASTTTESSNDSDHASSPSKKSDAVDGSKVKVANSKYEVVCKATSDDSNSSKLSTVILKRKSVSSERKKSEERDLPLPKMTKIATSPECETILPDNVAKRRHVGDTPELEKQRTKHAKHEEPPPRVPLLTIKTNGAKVVHEPKEVTDENNTQTMMEHLVKNKQGVTIKKITKECKKSAVSSGLSTTAVAVAAAAAAAAAVAPAPAPVPAPAAAAAVNVESKEKEKNVNTMEQLNGARTAKNVVDKKGNETAGNASNAQNTPNAPKAPTYILKDLVPFVEIKKELPSDDEDAERQRADLKHELTNVSTVSNTNSVKVVVTTTSNTVQPTPAPIEAQNNTPTAATEAPILTAVKKEVLSEDDETVTTATLLKEAADKTTATLLPLTAAVRVVGDTTIQRLSTKSTVATTPQSSQTISAVSNSNAGKRTSTRGVPYGPLPAAASVTTVARTSTTPISSTNAASSAKSGASQTHAEQHPQLQQSRHNQRARKSFPNRSPTEVSPTRSGLSTTSAALVPLPTVNCLSQDVKRSLLKTSMVAIPVDVATSRTNNPIPVPPLTAVSKVTQTSSALAAASTQLPPSTIITTTPVVTSFTNCNGSGTAGTLMLSTPPPLAGLSQTITNVSSTVSSSSLSAATASAALASVVTAVNATLPTVASSSNNNSSSNCLAQNAVPAATAVADAHLLGDFVTPTLASAITEVICRGPPKMIARPNGPLQSEGSAMFPSQAGPVCRTLVENAHKLTDFFISVMEDTMCEMSVGDESVLQAKITLLTMELERTKQAYEHEIAELKRTSDLMLCEMRKSMENEKTRLANDIRKQCEIERLRSVEETKKKQWCANCGREAQFYCCWNTSYCDYPCQQLHWSRHASSCAQTRPSVIEAGITTATTTGSSSQLERQYASAKTHASSSNAVGASQYNKTIISNKKDKHGSNNKNNSGSTTITAIPNNAAQTAEMLKLPSNTYLRPVSASNSSNHNASSVRSSSYAMPMSMPVQRFNIPLPITAAVNTAPPYTIVQRGSSWELMSTASSSAAGASPQALSAANMPGTASLTTVAAAQHQQQQQQHQQQTRLTGLPLNSTLQCGSGSVGVLRPAQM